MNLIIDIGNTRVKVALFERGSVFLEMNFSKKEIIKRLKIISKKYKIDDAILSSVAILSKKEHQEIQEMFSLLVLNYKVALPFNNKYATPETLGVDRIALVTAAVYKYPNKNVLVIDAGTCITYDFVNDKSEYFGGAIAPGIEMRYKALHVFTGKLPLLSKQHPENLFGNSTSGSIHSGVVNGVLAELNGIIAQYKCQNEKLTIVLTGGDTNFLSKRLKNGIFANPTFLLEGLNIILTYNIENV